MSVFGLELAAELEQAGVGIAHVAPDGRIEAVNEAYGSMLGRKPSTLIGLHWRDTIHPEDHSLAEGMYDAARRGVPGACEVRARREDAKIISLAIRTVARREADGPSQGFLCVLQDITAHRVARSHLELAVDVAPSGLIIVQSDGTITTANRAAEALFGYSREELVGQSIEILIPRSARERHKAHRERFHRDPNITAMAARDLIGERRDGSEIPIQVFLNVIETAQGRMTLCTVMDIAERMRYEEQLERARLAAESANRAKSDFLARMSHEIRTPMNLIMGMGSILLETPLTKAQREYLEISDRNVRRLVRLTNGILDLARIEAGKLTFDQHPFDVKELVSEAIGTILPAAERKGLELGAEIAEGVHPSWLGDAERIQQILLNVVGNAIKFTAEGSVTVRVSGAECDGQPGLRFSVEDTGCGISEEQAHLVFDVFQQGDGSLNRKFEGSGLGLAISRSLCQMMGGSIWLGRKEAPGTRVEFTVFPTVARRPSSGDSPVDTRQWAIVEPRLPEGTHILLAEDNPENALLVRAYLEGLPVSIDHAEDGLQAVAKCAASHYHLILMDIQMPVLDGMAATRRIRAWESAQGRARTPIIALTAHALVHAADDALRAGCDYYLAKPVERRDLVDAIGRFVKAPAEPKASFEAQIEAGRGRFLSNRRKDLETIRSAKEKRDLALLQRIGHNCKGTSKGYGYPAIGIAGAALEAAARNADLAALETAIAEFAEAVQGAVSGEVAPTPIAV